MNKFYFFLYRFFLAPLSIKLIQFLSFFGSEKLNKVVQLKNELIFNKANQLDNPIWIHASSGEIEYAKSIIREIKKQLPNEKIMVTYSSPSAIPLIQKIESEIDAWGPIPWDQISEVKKFIQHWNPKIILFSRTDVWPEVVYQLHKKNIPTALFSATLTEDSGRVKGITGNINSFIFSILTQIFCVSDDDLKVFNKLGVSNNIQVSGDTRYDQVFYRLSHSNVELKNSLKPSSEKPTIVLGSTWNEDENIIIPVIKNFPEFQWIIVPHEINKEHLIQIQRNLESENISYLFYSTAEKYVENTVLVVDKIGLLAEIYQWGNVAFVGGSFKKQVHSVMEPLACGLPVIVGPYHLNNREAVQFKNKKILNLNIVSVIKDSCEFKNTLDKILDFDLCQINNDLKSTIMKEQGKTQTIVNWVKENLSK